MSAIEEIRAKRSRMTEFVVSTDYERRPELLARYGAAGRAFYERDNDHHLAFLAEAVAADDPDLFADYAGWARSMLEAHGVLVEDLVRNFQLIREAAEHHLSDGTRAAVLRHLDAALDRLPHLPAEPETFVCEDAHGGVLAHAFLGRLLDGDRRGAARLLEDALSDGMPLRSIYLDVIQNAQREVGRLWQLNLITVAQEHFCTAATMAIMNGFYRDIAMVPRTGPRLTCCCVEGELHELGLRIVADFFELEGWDCDYVGANTPAADLVRTLERAPPDMIAIGVTMTYHLDGVRDLVSRIRAAPRLARLPVLVGGRPFLVSRDLWRGVGADGVAPDAEAAVIEGARLVGTRRDDA